MNRRGTLGIGVLGGGLLAAALVPMAVAGADDRTDGPGIAWAAVDSASIQSAFDQATTAVENIEFEFTDNGTGYTLTPSGDNMVNISHSGDGVDGGSAATTVGDDGIDVHVIEHTWSFGDITTVKYIIDTQQDFGDTAGVPEDGSVFIHTEFGEGFSNNYINLAGDGEDTVTDVLTTPFGSFELPLDDGTVTEDGADLLSELGFSDDILSDMGLADIFGG